MGVLLVALFRDGAGARAGLGALAARHADGRLSVYAAASLAGAMRQDRPRPCMPLGGGATGPMRAALGSMAASPALAVSLGALRSLTAGPLALSLSSVPSALIGTLRDLDEAGVDATLLEWAARHAGSAGGGVLAEVLEERVLELDASLLSLGGRVARGRLERAAEAEERLLCEIAAIRAELGAGGAEAAAAMATVERGLYAEARRLRECALRRAMERATSLAQALRREAGAKVSVLRRQASRVPERRRATIAERAALERASLEARVGRLIRATQHAFPAAMPVAVPAPRVPDGRGPA